MSWREEASCKNTNVNLFFARYNSLETLQALAICKKCPVSLNCLQDVIHIEKIRTGIRGGLTPRERQMLVNNAIR